MVKRSGKKTDTEEGDLMRRWDVRGVGRCKSRWGRGRTETVHDPLLLEWTVFLDPPHGSRDGRRASTVLPLLIN